MEVFCNYVTPLHLSIKKKDFFLIQISVPPLLNLVGPKLKGFTTKEYQVKIMMIFIARDL